MIGVSGAIYIVSQKKVNNSPNIFTNVLFAKGQAEVVILILTAFAVFIIIP